MTNKHDVITLDSEQSAARCNLCPWFEQNDDASTVAIAAHKHISEKHPTRLEALRLQWLRETS